MTHSAHHPSGPRPPGAGSPPDPPARPPRRVSVVEDPPDLLAYTAQLLAAKAAARAGDPAATAAQRAKGKLTVDERLELLFDEGSFTELEPLRRHRATAFGMAQRRPEGDGVVVGWVEVHGRPVFAYTP